VFRWYGRFDIEQRALVEALLVLPSLALVGGLSVGVLRSARGAEGLLNNPTANRAQVASAHLKRHPLEVDVPRQPLAHLMADFGTYNVNSLAVFLPDFTNAVDIEALPQFTCYARSAEAPPPVDLARP